MTLGTILAERLVDLVTLIGLLAAAALTVYAGHLPSAAVDALVGGVAVSLGGMLVVLALPRCETVIQRVIPARWHPAYARFEFGAVRSLRRLPVLAAYSALGWLIEGTTLWLLGLAIGVNLSATGALVAGLVASLLSVEPVTPGGLGVTEPGIVLVLTSLGVAAAGASTVALLNRVVNYLSLAFAGAIILCPRPRSHSRVRFALLSAAPTGADVLDFEARLRLAATAKGWTRVVQRCVWCHRVMDKHGDYTDIVAVDDSIVATDGVCPRCRARAQADIATRQWRTLRRAA
jgi:hypothetical protein